MKDEELGRELRALTPEPAAGYWTRIDAMLAGVEAEGGGDASPADGSARVEPPTVGEDSRSQDRPDTDDNVVRLTDMNQQRDLLHRFNGHGGLVLAVAASIVILFAAGGLLVLRDDSTSIDATTGDGQSDTTSSPDGGTGVTGADSDGDPITVDDGDDTEDRTSTAIDGADGGDADAGESMPTAPITATYCFGGTDIEDARGELATRLVVREDDTAVAVQRFRIPNGEDTVTEATGFLLDRNQRTYAMKADLGGQVLTRIWRISDGGLSTDIETFYVNADCDEVDQFLDGIAMPDPVTPDPQRHNQVLDAGTYCWLGEDTIRGLYQLTVFDDGVASVRSYTTDDSITPVVTTIATGTGVFTSDNEIAFTMDRWTSDGFTAESAVYTISGDRLQPTIYPSFLAEPVDCDVLDQWRLADEGLNIYINEQLSFESGTTATTVEGDILRGELAIYALEAERGQTMTVTVSSLEDNAGVEVYTPDSLAILDNEDGAGSRSVVLPDTGIYQVVVSSLRGNVSFTLDVDIR